MHTKLNDKIRKVLSRFLLGGIALVFSLGASGSPVAYAQEAAAQKPGKYYTVTPIILSDGRIIEEDKISGPPLPPPGFEVQRQAVSLPKPDSAAGIQTLTVPAFNWVFGCSAVSGAMIAGYYDRTGFTNMYTGPTNGGVMPMNNSSWPTWSDGSSTYPNCPLIASKNGVDGRATRGSIDDYWVEYNSSASDPYITNVWTQHTWGDAIGDYMKTSQSAYGNSDGSTNFYNYTSSASPLTCDDMETYGIHTLDGTYGRKLFYEARGYTVTDCYSQKTDNTVAGGFSFAQFKAEIDAGRPVMLNLEGHTVVGVGYDDSSNLVYIHDTWDYNNHTMTWGTSYSGMALLSVSIVNLLPPCTNPDPFAFTDQTNVELNTVTTSNGITVSGLCAPAPISITGGTYSINGGEYTSSAGTVSNGNTVTVRQTSSGSYYTTTDAVLTIGGLSDTFSVTTKACTGAALLTENFDAAAPPSLPSNWAQVNLNGTTGNWATETATVNPPGGGTHSAPNIAYFNSYTAASGISTRLYRTVGLNLSGISAAVVSFWMYHDTGYSGFNDNLQLQVSTDGGTNWNNIGNAISRYDGTTAWKQHFFDISAYTGPGMADVRIALLGISGWGNDIHLDDVGVTSCTAGDVTPPTFGTVMPSNTSYGSFVDSPFDLTTTFTDSESAVTTCEYCVSTDGTCDTEWAAGVLSGSSPTWTCTKTGMTGTNGQTLTLNMRATSSGGTGTATQITRTVDAAAPTTTDNQTSSNWQATEKTITLTPNDGTGSGVTASTGIYGCFGAGCTPAVLGGSTLTTACGAGNECTYDVRYYAKDNVGNTETTKTSTYQARVDRKAPQVSNVTPSDTINDAYPTIAADFSDAGSGIDVASVSLTLDGGVMSNCTTTASNISCVSSHLLSGEHTIGGSVADILGNSAPISGGFTLTYLPVRLARTNPLYYSAVQDALDAASDGDTIEIQAGDFIEPQLMFDKSNVAVTLHGGYDSTYTPNAGITSIAGTLTISNGTVIVDQITIW